MFDISHGNRTHGQGLKGTLIRGGITKIKIWRDIIFKVPIVDIEIKRSWLWVSNIWTLESENSGIGRRLLDSCYDHKESNDAWLIKKSQVKL